MDAQFIRDRITQLRLQKGVSEYRMSYDLCHSRSYIYNISSGKALPPLTEFLAICEYLGVTPQQFFDPMLTHPAKYQRALDGLAKLDDKDLDMIIAHIERLTQDR